MMLFLLPLCMKLNLCRRCSYSQYSTTTVPAHRTRSTGQRLVPALRPIDGLYYIEYSQDLFDTFEKKNIKVYRQGSFPTPVLHCRTPTQLLVRTSA